MDLRKERGNPMLKKLGMTGLVLASALAVLGPQVASARDRDDSRYRDNGYYNNGYYNNGYSGNGYYNGYDSGRSHEAREWREHEQREWREHERREHQRRYDRGSYQNGYYDSYGNWHSYGY